MITTDRSLISLPALNAAFATPALYWASPFPEPVLSKTIANSCCFTLLTTEAQIGFARGITDYVTFFYLTDVYVLEPWQNQGLGRWLVECVQEFVDSLGPYVRRTMLISSHGIVDGHGEHKEGLYERIMHVERIGREDGVWHWKGPGSMT